MFNRTDISEGMIVKSLDGERLGKVISLSPTSFEIEKGYFFVKDYRVHYADVSGITNGEVTLAISKEGLRSAKEAAPSTSKAAPMATATGAVARPFERLKEKVKARRAGEGWSDEVRIPLHHEELAWSKTEKDSGEVRIHKSVVEEERTITIPLRHETVRVEHRPFAKEQPLGSMAFKEETVVIPLHAESAELRKTQVADEEVVIHKDAIEEQRSYSDRVMRETVDVEEEGSTRAARGEPRSVSPTPKYT